MAQLTATELRVLNDISNQRNANVSLGTLLNTIEAGSNSAQCLVSFGTQEPAPAKAKTNLVFNDIVQDQDTVVIDNPLISGSLIFKFFDNVDEFNGVHTGYIPVDLSSSVTPATCSFIIPVVPSYGDTFTIGTKTYTFVPNGTDNGEGEIGILESGLLSDSHSAIVAAINGTDGVNTKNPDAQISDFDTETSTALISALHGGTSGNTIALTETFTAPTNRFDGQIVLEDGEDAVPSACANALLTAYALVPLNARQGVSMSLEYEDTILVEALEIGEAGNNILVSTTGTGCVVSGEGSTLYGGTTGVIYPVGQIFVKVGRIECCVSNDPVMVWKYISYDES